MKKKLLTLLTIVLFSVTAGYSQATAYDVPDIFICNDDVDVDLTQQNPIVLGNQNPEDFYVVYFHSQTNAEENVNPIDEPTSYFNELEVEEIFIRVTNIADGSYDIASFTVGYIFTNVSYFADFNVCGGEFTLPPLSDGNYYTQPGGQGTMLSAGDVLSTSQTVYIYNQNEEVPSCTAESDFDVIMTNLVEIDPVPPLEACDEDLDGYAVFDLNLVINQVYDFLSNQPMDFYVSIHESEADAAEGVSPLPPGQFQAYTNTAPYQQTLYLRIYAAGGECYQIMPFTIVASDCENTFLTGTVMYDVDDNGCDNNDIPATGLTVVCTNNGYSYYSVVDNNGNYAFNYIPAGQTTVAVAPDPYVDFISSPSEYNITTPSTEDGLDFCLLAEDVNDVLVWLMPTSAALPGFETTYTLIYANYGTLPSSGVISLNFDDTMLTFDSAMPAMQQNGNVLSVAYNDLQPFATEYAYITFTVMQPPTVNMGDILDFEAIIDAQVDDNMANNTYEISQIVTNSYDPNDITVREGASITPEQAEDYLHYTIRFQNEGTANAQIVRIETQLDANLDWDTFMPMNSSHSYEIVRDENGGLEFIFDGIDLPYTDADEAGSQGYIIYRIKPKSTVELGDSMSATAGIYFDFNEAVMTNTATTTIEAAASADKFENNLFTVYPNPASGNVNIAVNNFTGEAQINVTDVLGKTVLNSTISDANTNIDVSSLKTGVYFITLQAQDKSATKKVVIK
ncbi:hypothetical protein GCM10007424_00980 [Flavobacterium suaedae]|uniref:T9SS type A sorting domain-containing protein n=1 Tax=Flavobacterium suaedae TaxID=1767027 RepID=A0ABQ1JBS1_9FLAO|nr:T9SS type A sorting domain-containing protein [Flavobacterium suaedae]GGB64868.1 hypothetical protein GCM10007424_00980 [Flavobacterium suaedae]